MNGEPNELTTKCPRQCFTIQLVFKGLWGEWLPSISPHEKNWFHAVFSLGKALGGILIHSFPPISPPRCALSSDLMKEVSLHGSLSYLSVKNRNVLKVFSHGTHMDNAGLNPNTFCYQKGKLIVNNTLLNFQTITDSPNVSNKVIN